ncbi:MAG: type II toxin-antitoxin system prevent-host-death family antitoxin [Vulcanimicrobiota bacterium]
MEKVGIRELKDNLSAYLRKVATGQVINVTDRGRVVAELRPPMATVPGFEDFPPLYWEKIASGELRRAPQVNSSDFYDNLPRGSSHPAGTAQRLIDEDRGER